MSDPSPSASGPPSPHYIPPSPLSSFAPRAALSSSTSSDSPSVSLDGSPPRLYGPVYDSSPAYVRTHLGGWRPTPVPPYRRSPLALLVPPTLPAARRHPPTSKRYLVKAGRTGAPSIQVFTLPPQFAHDRDAGRRRRVYAELLVATVERRLADKAARMEGVGIEGGREMALLAAVNTHKLNKTKGVPFPTAPQLPTPPRSSSLGLAITTHQQVHRNSASTPRSLTHRRSHSSPTPPPPAEPSGTTQLLRSFVNRRGGRHESNLSLDELEFAKLAKERAVLEAKRKAEKERQEALRRAFAAQVRPDQVALVPVWDPDSESDKASTESDGSDETAVDVVVEIQLIPPPTPAPTDPILLPDFAPVAAFDLPFILNHSTDAEPNTARIISTPVPVLVSPSLATPPAAFLRRRAQSTCSESSYEGAPLARSASTVPPMRKKSWRMKILGSYAGDGAGAKPTAEGRGRKRSWFGVSVAAA